MGRILRLVTAGMVAVAVAGCSTFVTIETEPEDAAVYINNEYVGDSPIRDEKLSNVDWRSYYVRIEAEGYETYRGQLEKELKVGGLIVGLLLWWPQLFYIWAPQGYYFFPLREE